MLLQVWERLAWDQVALRDKSVVLFHYYITCTLYLDLLTIIYSDFGFGVFDWQQRSLWSFVCFWVRSYFQSQNQFLLFYWSWGIKDPCVHLFSWNFQSYLFLSLFFDQHIRFNNLILKSFIVSVYLKACEHDWENNAR